MLSPGEVPDKFCRDYANSGFGGSAGRALGLLEEALCRFASGHGILSPRLFWTTSLILARPLLAPSRFPLGGATLNAIAGCKANFEFDDLVPYRVGALMIRNRQQFAQAAARIRCLWFVAHRGCRRLLAARWGDGGLLFDGRRVDGRLIYGFFLAHFYIIARIIGSVPVLSVPPDLVWGF